MKTTLIVLKFANKFGAKLITVWLLMGFAFLSGAIQAYAVTDIYYSIGTSTADLKTGSPNMTISGGVATLDVAQTGNIGAGDVISYRSGALSVYIKSVVNNTTFVVQTVTGATPGDYYSSVTSIKRTFNSISSAITNAKGSSYLNSSNLVSLNVDLSFVCYKDGVFDEKIYLTGYTVDATRNITLTAAGSSQVASGSSQRHTGIEGTGAIIRPNSSSTDSILVVELDYTTIEWLEVSGVLAIGSGVSGISVSTSAGDYSIVRNNIVHDTRYDNIFIGSPGCRVYNNISYNALQACIHVRLGNNSEIYNNSAYSGSNGGIKVNNATGITVRNNISMASYDFWVINGGSITASSNNLSSDDTADDFGGTGNLINKTASNQFVSLSGTIDLHLKSGSDAIGAGGDLSAAFANDIDGKIRTTVWDIGADEITDPLIYYSVGADTSALYSGNASASSGMLTLATSAVDRIGIGDEVRQGSNRFYITGRSSSTVFSIQNSAANGGTPGATNISFTSQSISIYRAFNSLSAAQTGSSNASHLNTASLVAGNFQLSWACYNDGPDTSMTAVSGWTTGASNHIRIFTPTTSTEVGTTQRHRGVAGTGYRIAPVNSAQAYYNIIDLQVPYVRIEGIEIDGSGLTNAYYVRGILVMPNMTNVGDIRIDSTIIHDLATNAGSYLYEGTSGIHDQQQASNVGPPMRITNNTIYNLFNNINVGHITGIHIGSRTTSYVYNNTVYNIRNAGPSSGGPAFGIVAKAWQSGGGGSATVIAKNNYVGNVTAPYNIYPCFYATSGGTITQSYNVSSDSTASGTGSKTLKTAYSSYFASM
jgi:hypothetical protein